MAEKHVDTNVLVPSSGSDQSSKDSCNDTSAMTTSESVSDVELYSLFVFPV